MKMASRYRLLLGAALPVLLGTALYGCSDFLDEAGKAKGTLNEQTLANANGVEGSLIAAYRALDWNNGVGGGWGNAASNWVWGSVTSDDAYKGSEKDDQPAINDIEAYFWNTADAEGYLNDKWRGMYEGVVRSNATLRLLDQLVQGGGGGLSEEDINGIRGEALFLRAHYHFEAWRMWVNIPYYKETDLDFRKAQEDSTAVVADLLADLNEAISLLPEDPRKGQVGRATKWAATAYKGRLQAYIRDWPGAKTTLQSVVASGKYDLETSFEKVWTGMPAWQNGKETILAYQASTNDGDPNGDNGNWGERLNFPHSGSPFGCCGFHQPSQNLVNFFRVDANGLPLALANESATAAWNADSTNQTAGKTANTLFDARLDWTVGRDSVPYKDWGIHDASWIRAPGYGGHYSGKKLAYEKASNAQSNVGWVGTQLSSANMHIFRYADALLLLAEADVETGSLEAARAIVNRIRARAAVHAQGPGTTLDNMAVPLNDPSIKWAKYAVGQYTAPWTDANVARRAVRIERRLELAMEGQRFFDLKRWGTFVNVLNDYVSVEKSRRPYLQSAAPVEERHGRYPLPQIQIELSRQNGVENLTQNPGW